MPEFCHKRLGRILIIIIFQLLSSIKSKINKCDKVRQSAVKISSNGNRQVRQKSKLLEKLLDQTKEYGLVIFNR